eukprot:gene5247-6071_t
MSSPDSNSGDLHQALLQNMVVVGEETKSGRSLSTTSSASPPSSPSTPRHYSNASDQGGNVPPPVPARSASNMNLSPASPKTISAGGGSTSSELRKFAQRKYNAVASFLSLTLKDEETQQTGPTRMTWNDFESEYERELPSLPESLRFPAGDVIVKRIERFPRFVFPPTLGLVIGSLDLHVRDLVNHLYKDYLIVETKGCGLQQGTRKHSVKTASYIGSSNTSSSSPDPTQTILNTTFSASLKSHLFANTKNSISRGPLRIGDEIPKIMGQASPSTSSASIPVTISSTLQEDPLKQLIPERMGLELLCEVKELKLLQDIEPLFCSLYIVDIDKRERISECFNFHLNTKQLVDSLKMDEQLLNGWSNQRQCIFSLNKYHPNMYFILRVYHIFRGDIERDIKPYIKNKSSAIGTFKSEVADKCTSWGTGDHAQILQPFFWTAYPVFHSRPTLASASSSLNLLQFQQQQQQQQAANSPTLASNTLSPPNSPQQPHPSSSPSLPSSPTPPPLPLHNIVNKARSNTPPPITTSSTSNSGTPATPTLNCTKTNIEMVNMVPCTPNLSDRSISEMLISNDKEFKKLKTVQGTFTMTIRTMDSDEDLCGRISPSLIPLLPLERDNPPNLIREIQDFSETPYPFADYVNNLYIYPETAFIKYKNPNLQIQVQLLDDLSSLKSVKCIYPSTPPYIPTNLWETLNQAAPGQPGPSTTMPYPPLEYASYSAVNFHDKRPLFTEEFKVKMPTKITNQHLLFTFYHVNINAKKDQKTAIGYAAVPLMKDGLFLKDDTHHIAIQSELNGIETVFLKDDSKKEKIPSFTFRTKLISSIITQDTALSHFFHLCSNSHDSIGRTLDAVKGILKIDRLSCVQFFPIILDQLFIIMCCSANEVASQAFAAILHTIKIVDGYEKKAGIEKSRLLTYYSEYVFDYLPDSKSVYEELCRQWVSAINTGIYVKDFRLNWFLFDIMTKSMALALHNSGQLDSDIGRENRFKIEFQENLNRLVLKLLPQFDASMSVQSWEFFTKFPYFINNLFPLIDRGFLFNLIHNYISRIVTTSTEEKDKDTIIATTIKFNFLKIISDYDHYIPLNFPQPIKVIDSISDLHSKFFKRHFIAVLLLNEVESCLKQNKMSIRNQAILTLKQLLKKHHFDPRYQQQEIREMIATIYFPFVLMMVEHYSILKHSLDPSELPEWLTCLVWILQYCNRDLLRLWFMKETETRQNSFLSLILLSMNTFKEEPSIYEIILLDIEICRIILREFKVIDDRLFNVVINNIQCASSMASHDLLPEIYKLIREVLIPNHPQHIFQHPNNSYCEVITYELLCAADVAKLSAEAASLFYCMLERNFSTTNDVVKMKIQSTVAISKLVGELKLGNANNLIGFLTRVKEHTKTHESAVFKSQIEEVINRINTLIKYSNTISANRSDIEVVAEMYYNISISYYESPNLRVTWLENLSKKNNETGQFDEAAQCLIQSAYLISRYLSITGKFTQISKADFTLICPNVSREQELPPIDLKDDSLFQSWTMEYMVQLLEESIVLSLKANRYELAIEIHSLVSKIYKIKKDYKSLINTLSNQKVSFQGPRFEEMDAKEFIYKKPADCLLKTIQTQIKEHLYEKFGKDEASVVLLPNTPFDRETLDPTKLYYQIITVEPYIELGQLSQVAATDKDLEASFDQYFGVSQFISETAHSNTGKAIQEDMSKQLKKKTIFIVDPHSFPYLKNRIEVSSKREIILSPIENAIELIKGRIVKLIEQLQTPSPRINLLQQVIQGSVFPMVNEGSLKICEVFLSKSNGTLYNAEHVDQLKKAMERFIHYCGWTIKLNKGLISPQHQEFQNMVEKQFEILKKEVHSYL